MKHLSWRSLGIITIGLLVIGGLLCVSAYAYWQYANYIPSYESNLPPPPEPNGFEIAAESALALNRVNRPL